MCFGTTLICTRCNRRVVRYRRRCDNNEPHPIYGCSYRVSFLSCDRCCSESPEALQEHEQFQRDIERAKRVMEYMRGELLTPYTSGELIQQACDAAARYSNHEALHPYPEPAEYRDFMIMAEDETAVDEVLRRELEICLRRQREILAEPERRITQDDIYYRYSNIVERFRTRQASSVQINTHSSSLAETSETEIGSAYSPSESQGNVKPVTFLQWTATNGHSEGSDELKFRSDVQACIHYMSDFPNDYLELFVNTLHGLDQEEARYDFVPSSNGSDIPESFRAWRAERGYEPHTGQADYHNYLREQHGEQQSTAFWDDRQRFARNHRRFVNLHCGGQWEDLELVAIALSTRLDISGYQSCDSKSKTEFEGQGSNSEKKEQGESEEEKQAMTFTEWLKSYHCTGSDLEDCILTDEEKLRDETYVYENSYLRRFPFPRQLDEFRSLRHQIEADRVNFDFEPIAIDKDVNLVSFREFLEHESADITDSNDWERCLTSYQLHLVADAPSLIVRGFSAARSALCHANRLKFEGLLGEPNETEKPHRTRSGSFIPPNFIFEVVSQAVIDTLRVQAQDHHLKRNINWILDGIVQQREYFGVRIDPEWSHSEVIRVTCLLQMRAPCPGQAQQQASYEDLELNLANPETETSIDYSTEAEFEPIPFPSLANYTLHHPKRTQLYDQVRLEPESTPYMFQAGNMRPKWPDISEIDQIQTVDHIEILDYQLEYAAQWYSTTIVAQSREAHKRLSALTSNNAHDWHKRGEGVPRSAYLIGKTQLENSRDRRRIDIEATMAGEEAENALELEGEHFERDLHKFQLDELVRTRHERWDLSGIVDPENVRETNEARDRRLIYQETVHRHRLQHDMEELIHCIHQVQGLSRYIHMRRTELIHRCERESLILDYSQFRRQIRQRQGVSAHILTLLSNSGCNDEEYSRATETMEEEQHTLREYQGIFSNRTSTNLNGSVSPLSTEVPETAGPEDAQLVAEILVSMANEGLVESEAMENGAEQQHLRRLLDEATATLAEQEEIGMRLHRRAQLARTMESSLRQLGSDRGIASRLTRALALQSNIREQADLELQASLNRSQELARNHDAALIHLQDFLNRREEERQRQVSDLELQRLRTDIESQIEVMNSEVASREAPEIPSSDCESDLDDDSTTYDDSTTDNEDDDEDYDSSIPLTSSGEEPILVLACWLPQETNPEYNPFMSRDDLFYELEYERIRRQNRLTIVIEPVEEVFEDPNIAVQATQRRLAEEAHLRMSNQRVTGDYDRDDFSRMVAFDHEDVLSSDED